MRRALLLLPTALLAAAAPAAAAWMPARRASQGPLPARRADVAVNARGDAAMAWVQGAGNGRAIVVSRRPAGAAWDPATPISDPGQAAIDASVGVDAAGGVTVVWRQLERTRLVRTAHGRRRQPVLVVRARQRGPQDPGWGPVATLSSARQKAGTPEVGVDAAGEALAAWHWGTGTSPSDPGFVGQVQYASLTPGRGWSAAQRISRTPACRDVRRPHVAVAPSGDAAIWWQCDLHGGRSTAIGVSRPANGTVGREAELPFRQRGDVAADLDVGGAGFVAVSAAADGTLSWWRGSLGATLSATPLATLAAAERANRTAGPPRIAGSPEGDALSAWIDSGGRPRATPVAPDLGAGAPTSLADAAGVPGPVGVAAAAGRRGAVAWIADGRVYGAQRTAAGELPPASTLSAPGVLPADPPAVAADATGAAVVAWTRRVGGRTVVERAEASAP